MDATPQWVIVFGQDLRILHVNRPALREFGRSLAEVVGRPWEALGLPAEVMRPLTEEVRRSLQDGRVRQGELELHGLGETRWFEYHLQRALDADGRTIVVSSHQEITALRRLAQDVENYACIAAHDLRGPLVSIGLRTEMLDRELDAEGVGTVGQGPRRHLEAIRTTVRRLDALVGALLQYTRAGRIEPRLEPHDPHQSLDVALEMLAPAIQAEGATVEVADLPWIMADAHLLARVWQNLLHNSLRYRGPAPPAIRITSERIDDDVCIFVTDNGIGFPPGSEGEAVQPFTRLHRSGLESGGAGLGLAVCSRILEAHGGALRVLPHEGGARIALRVHAAVPEGARVQLRQDPSLRRATRPAERPLRSAASLRTASEAGHSGAA